MLEKIQAGSNADGSVNSLKEEKWLAKIIEQYNKRISKANTSDDLIFAIATLAKKIESYHFFPDGNLRTVRLIILKLLLQNKLSLTCIKEPNIIDGFSSEQIAYYIKRDMNIYLDLQHKPKIKMFSDINALVAALKNNSLDKDGVDVDPSMPIVFSKKI